MIYIDRKYLLFISPRLDRFKEKKTDLFNFRCPFCGDSKKSKIKARAYIYRGGNDYFFRCHNCHVSTTFNSFLKHMDAQQYKAYCMENYVERDNKFVKHDTPNIKEMLTGPKPANRFKKIIDLDIPSINDLPKEHYARVYIENRRIPAFFWSEIFYTDYFKDFLDKNFPDHGKKDLPNDPRLILLYTTPDQTITTVAGRSLEPDNRIRYISVKVTDDKKVFGIHHLVPNQKVYITEGQFDSMFLPNAVASGDANLRGMAEYLKTLGHHNLVLVFDNQPRNKDVVREVGYAIEENRAVVLLPYDPNSKDINEMIRMGMSKKEVRDLIDSHTYQGLMSNMKFIEWRKC